MRYELSKPQEYRLAREKAPIAYIPWGAHEWHGVHNPLGTDTLKAHGMCLALCAETGGVVFPPVYCGYQTMKPCAGFDSTLEFSIECVKMLVREYLEQLADEGFRVIIIVMGHYGNLHVKALEEEIEEFNARQDRAVAWGFPDYEPTSKEGFPGDHGYGSETSYMMFLHPELVDLSRLPTDRDLAVEQDGIGGKLDPRTEASAKRGKDGISILVKNTAPRILELLQNI